MHTIKKRREGAIVPWETTRWKRSWWMEKLVSFPLASSHTSFNRNLNRTISLLRFGKHRPTRNNRI